MSTEDSVESVTEAADEYRAALTKFHARRSALDALSAAVRDAESSFLDAKNELNKAQARLLAAAQGRSLREVSERELAAWQQGLSVFR